MEASTRASQPFRNSAAEAPTVPPGNLERTAVPDTLGGPARHKEGAGYPGHVSHSQFLALTEFLAPPQGPGEIGRLGPYRVLEILGAGGMGVVFRAEDVQLRRPVALKAMLSTLAVSSSARERFLREARAAAAIEHDHIITIFQVGEDRGIPFLAMPLLQGELLEDLLRREAPLAFGEVLKIGREIALGLAAAHQRGLIHRDIKPANIWLESRNDKQPRLSDTTHAATAVACRYNYRVKILDFGLARASDDQAHLTQQGTVMGTPAYMAPEQANGQGVDHRSDLFSLGCVLYQISTGERPFRGTDTIAVLLAVATEEPRPPRERRPEIPPAFSELIMQLLAKQPGDRPGSAAQVADILQDIAADRPGTPASTMISAAPAKAPRPVRAGRRWGLVAAAALVMVGLGIAGFHFLPRFFTSPPDKDPGGGNVESDSKLSSPKQPVEKVTNTLGMELRLIRPGTFLMGSPASEVGRKEDEGPAHKVTITKPFYLGVHEVTVSQFRWFTRVTDYKTEAEKWSRGLGPIKHHKGAQRWTGNGWKLDSKCNWRKPGWFLADDQPVVCVTWHDAQAFCEWLSRKEKQTYRLPTEAEWEYACRAGTTSPFAFGATLSSSQANFNGQLPYGGAPPGPYREKAIQVGSFPANAWGFADMHGNVWEWCADWYGDNYYGESPVQDPQGPPSGTRRVYRGGGWDSTVSGGLCRSACRQAAAEDTRGAYLGFRVVREP
jgi:formylglycine-generating enzyme required for sulfatase activity/tRNA A-37 threonylcarbamoyl transferase component Bud32